MCENRGVSFDVLVQDICMYATSAISRDIEGDSGVMYL